MCVCLMFHQPKSMYANFVLHQTTVHTCWTLRQCRRVSWAHLYPQYTVLHSRIDFCDGGVHQRSLISMCFSTIIQVCVWFVSGHPRENQ